MSTPPAVAEERRRYRPLLFFILAYGASWVPWLLGAWLGARPGGEGAALVLQFVGLLGPLAAALVLILALGDAALRRDFVARLVDLSRISPLFVVLAVAIPAAVMLVSIALSLLLGESADQFSLAAGGAGLLPMIVLAMLLAPAIEETGWRGYGVDSLRAGMGALPATLVFGLLWSLWHAPLMLIPGTYQHQLLAMGRPLYVANFFVSVLPAAIIANWVFWRNGRSILLGIFLHAMLNAAMVLPDAGQTAKCIATVLYALVAAAILVLDRPLFAQGPWDFAHDLDRVPAA